jgi:hypothetical protein
LALGQDLSTAEDTELVLDRLVAAGVVRREIRAGAQWYEITHDRLIQPIEQSNAEALAASRGLKWQIVLNAVAVLLLFVPWLAFHNIQKTEQSQASADYDRQTYMLHELRREGNETLRAGRLQAFAAIAGRPLGVTMRRRRLFWMPCACGASRPSSISTTI